MKSPIPRSDFPSDEEFWVYHWLMEAERYDLVKDITYQPGPFLLSEKATVRSTKQLKTKVKIVDKFLFRRHRYTPDFSFSLVSQILVPAFKMPGVKIIIDVKGGFNPYGDPKQFSLNQKWMWQKYDIYVEKIVPEKLFKKTWCPEICRLTPKQRKPVKKYIGVPVISEFMENQAVVV